VHLSLELRDAAGRVHKRVARPHVLVDENAPVHFKARGRRQVDCRPDPAAQHDEST